MKTINDARNRATRPSPVSPPAAAPVNAASAPISNATAMIAAHMISKAR
jgi:hypothetical protein